MSWLTWIAANWLTFLIVIFSFGFIVFVHELGHFAIAKRVGIRVYEFALGFGPRLLGRKRGETEYNLRIFPFGGFVRMEGEDDPESDPNDPGSFQNKPVLSQIAVLGGGCFMNYVCALVVFVFIGFAHGIPTIVRASVAVISNVEKESPAARAGLLQGDKVVNVDGKTIANWEDLIASVSPNPGKELKVTVLRDGQEQVFKVVPREKTGDDGKKVGQLGVLNSQLLTVQFEPATSGFQVFQETGAWLGRITILPAVIVHKMISKQIEPKTVAENMGGPLLIGQMFFEIYHQGVWALLFFWAFICASVGAFNLIPFPALDGARMLFLGFGAIRGRPLDPRKEGMVHMVGLMLLLSVMVLFTIQDVSRMIKGVKFFSVLVGAGVGS